MKLNIEIESGSFEKVISDGIKAISQDELKDIIKQVILEAFTKCDTFSNLLTKRVEPRWGSTSEIQLGPLAEAAVKNIDLEKELAPIKDKMVRALMDNHQKIVEDMFLRCFVEKIANDSTFYEMMKNTAYQILCEVRNNG